MFDPEVELGDVLWRTLDVANGDGAHLSSILAQMPKLRIVEIFRAYLLARTELVDRLFVTVRHGGASEDALDDFADSIVSMGRRAYIATYRGDEPVPPKSAWRMMTGLIHVFGDVFFDNFGEDIYDYLED
ncbi:MAG: hypothetical protein R3B40_26015 [Polyangiales bacterium]